MGRWSWGWVVSVLLAKQPITLALCSWPLCRESGFAMRRAYLDRSLAMCLLKPSSLPQCVFAMRLRLPNVSSQFVFAYPMCLRNASAPPNARTRACSSVLERTRAYSSVLERTRAYSCVLERTRAYSSVLEHTRAYSSVLERMREYSKCSRPSQPQWNLGRAAATSVGGRNLVLPPERPPSAPSQTTPLVSAMAQASKQTFQPYERKPRKPWVTDHTLQLLEQAKSAEAAQEDDAKHKRNVAKRSAHKDRINWIHDQLESDPAATRAAWHTAKNQKKGFVGARKHLVVDGKPQPWSKTHEAFRDHLQNKQWASPTIPDPTAAERRSREALYPTLGDEPLFTVAELTDAMAQLKKRKASGPDGIPNEL